MSLIFHPLPDFSPIVPAAVTPTSAAKVVSGTRRPLLRRMRSRNGSDSMLLLQPTRNWEQSILTDEGGRPGTTSSAGPVLGSDVNVYLAGDSIKRAR